MLLCAAGNCSGHPSSSPVIPRARRRMFRFSASSFNITTSWICLVSQLEKESFMLLKSIPTTSFLVRSFLVTDGRRFALQRFSAQVQQHEQLDLTSVWLPVKPGLQLLPRVNDWLTIGHFAASTFGIIIGQICRFSSSESTFGEALHIPKVLLLTIRNDHPPWICFSSGPEIQLRTESLGSSGHLPSSFFGQTRTAFASEVSAQPIGRDLFGLASMKVVGRYIGAGV
ncbi:hypothetical protein C8J56DRAFT_1026491 [Mycena floridula]|nr:hypothetical protein C8J56DRAFT_1026491 [Mycena floridula]